VQLVVDAGGHLIRGPPTPDYGCLEPARFYDPADDQRQTRESLVLVFFGLDIINSRDFFAIPTFLARRDETPRDCALEISYL